MADSDKLRMAARAEQDLNSYQMKQGLGPKSDSGTKSLVINESWDIVLRKYEVLESNIDERADKKFREATGIKTGREAGATGSNRKPIPEDEGGTRDSRGRLVFYLYFYVVWSDAKYNQIGTS